MKSGDIIEIIYMDHGGRFTQRKIRVVEAGDYYIKAFCYSRRHIRLFKCDNILAIKHERSFDKN